MRIGVCAPPDQIENIFLSGADYIECAVQSVRAGSADDKTKIKSAIDASKIKCEAMNVLFPGREIPLTGENVNVYAVETYARETFACVNAVCAPSVVVFGSGVARRCPDGFDRRKAFNQITETGLILAECAERYGFVIALEPLNRGECNMVNSLADGLSVVKKINHPNFKLLADVYHMLVENEPAGAILGCEGFLAHAHVAEKEGRKAPSANNMESIAPYIDALRKIDYDGRLSIEASYEAASLRDSVALLREIAS